MSNDNELTLDEAAQHIIETVNAGLKMPLTANGHTKDLYVRHLASSCGGVLDGTGISFEFDNEGGWVVSLFELEALVMAAKQWQATRKLPRLDDADEVQP